MPGRIEVLGKHTDYAGGRSLLCATDRGFAVAVAPGRDDRIRVADDRTGEWFQVPPGPSGAGLAGWTVYPTAVIRRARSDFGSRLPGCDILFESDLPSAAGLSSSTALITAVFLALDAVAGLRDTAHYRAAIRSREDLAAYLAAVERGSPFAGLASGDPGVGTRGGGQDHTAILCARAGSMVRYTFEPTRLESVVPVPDGWTFGIASSGVRAAKTGAARARYNRLSDLAATAAARWRAATGGDAPHLGAIAAAGPAAVARLLEIGESAPGPGGADPLSARVRHFLAESNEIVPAATDALAAGDLDRFGGLVDRSQALADRLLGNQVPETRRLAAEARRLGAVAASAFGAGFGGSVWALIPRDDAPDFLRRWRRAFERAGGRPSAPWFHTPAGPPARRFDP